MFKKIKSLTTMCPECEVEKEVQYGTKEETLTIRKENIDVISKVFYCPTGNHFFSDMEDDEEKIQFAYREYRKRKNILQPEGIKELRDKYGLSQQDFSLFLGYGAKTIARYETGAIPDDSHSYFMKLMQDTDSFNTHFNNIKNELPIKLRQKIESKISEFNETQSTLIMPLTYAAYFTADTIRLALSEINIGNMATALAIAANGENTDYIENGFIADKKKDFCIIAANTELALAA